MEYVFLRSKYLEYVSDKMACSIFMGKKEKDNKIQCDYWLEGQWRKNKNKYIKGEYVEKRECIAS